MNSEQMAWFDVIPVLIPVIKDIKVVQLNGFSGLILFEDFFFHL